MGLLTLDSFDHDGVVVKDAEATAKSWESKLGIGPWRFSGGGPLKLAHAKVNTVMYELLEPVEGHKSLWADFLAEHGEGLHHICHKVADVDDAVAKLVEDGGTKMIHMPGAMAYVQIGGPGSIIIELLKSA